MTNLQLTATTPKTEYEKMDFDAENRMLRSRAFKNTTSRPRERAAGSGPDRKRLPAFKHLLDIPKDIVKELNEFFYAQQSVNDLKTTDNYEVSTHCPLKYAIPHGFQHLLLTHVLDGKDGRLEQNYKQWTNESSQLRFHSWFKEIFPNAFRVRLSRLQSKTEFSWHIDTNTSVACRCSATLNVNQAQFEIKTRENIAQVPMKVGQIFFTNTGWLHRVYNEGPNDRLNLVFGVPFSDLQKWFRSKDENSFY